MQSVILVFIGVIFVSVVFETIEYYISNSFLLTYGIKAYKKEINNINDFHMPPVEELMHYFEENRISWKPSLIFKQVSKYEIIVKEKKEFYPERYKIKIGGPLHAKVKYNPYNLTLSLTCYCSLTFTVIILVVIFGFVPYYSNHNLLIDKTNLRILVLLLYSPAVLGGIYQIRRFNKILAFLVKHNNPGALGSSLVS